MCRPGGDPVRGRIRGYGGRSVGGRSTPTSQTSRGHPFKQRILFRLGKNLLWRPILKYKFVRYFQNFVKFFCGNSNFVNLSKLRKQRLRYNSKLDLLQHVKFPLAFAYLLVITSN